MSLRVLVACEYSGRVREAFRARGHRAWSCDFHPAEDGSKFHYQEDVRNVWGAPWDVIIAHPDCTFHTNASVRWFTTIPKNPKPGVFYGEDRWREWEKAIGFFKAIQRLKVQNPKLKLAIENPIMHGYSYAELGRPTQFIDPWQFGHKEFKHTGLWLYDLPKLMPTRIITPPTNPEERKAWAVVHRMPPGPDRWKHRSRTYQGIANAMAQQWG